MKKLFLFVLFAALCCSCTESGTDENTDPNGSLNSGQTTPPDPDSDATDVIHVPEEGMLAEILNELGQTDPSSLKLSGTLNIFDFMTIRNIQSLENLDISRVNLSVLPAVFSGCTNIKSLILPNTLTEIKSYALSESTLVTISIPASVETIEENAFYSCTSLKTVTFEKGSQLKTIQYCTFENCASLTSIEIPASVETIEGGSFRNCTSLQTITFEKGSQLQMIDTYGAFSDCAALTTVDMSACTQVTLIGNSVFNGNSQLQLFKIGTRTPPSCGYDVFEDINSYSILKVPAGCVDAYKEAIGWNRFTSISELDK